MRKKYDKASPEGRCAVEVQSIRVEATPDFDDSAPDLRVLIVLDRRTLPTLPASSALSHGRIDRLRADGITVAATAALDSNDVVTKREGWTALAELWLAPSVEAAEALDRVGEIDVEVLNGDELSFARSRNAPELDLAYLTTRAA